MSVVVTGMGQVSATGDALGTFWEALLSGVAAPERLSPVDAPGIPVRTAADARVDPSVHLGKKGLRLLDAPSRLVLVASKLALEAARFETGGYSDRLGVVLGGVYGAVTALAQFDRELLTDNPLYANPALVPFMVGNMAGANVAIRFGAGGPNLTLCQGAAGGLEAIAVACRLLESGQADAVLAGGVDAVSFESVRALHAAGILAEEGPGVVGVPYHPHSRGAVAGGAAGVLVLEREDAARARGAEILGHVRGSWSALGTSPSGPTAEDYLEACRGALEQASTPADALAWVCGGANGVPHLDRAELDALESLLVGTDAPVCSIKGAVGECTSAGGALSAIAAVLGLGAGLTPGMAGLSSGTPPPRLATRAQARSGRSVLCVAASWEGPVSAVVFARPA
ncbi:MAG: hypothetical protein M3Y59_19680 [Myxococcota bacterium]|nr:hypothetical protein [Myxococcota bacterium]